MLDLLRRNKRQHVKAVAEQLELTEDVCSKNLQLLASAGFLKFERDGKYLFYSLKSEDLFLQLVLSELADPEGDQKVMISMLTALTHERRIGIVSALKTGPQCMSDVCRCARISSRACVRHIDKLVRRGWVQLDDDICFLREPAGRFGKALLQFSKQTGHTCASVPKEGGGL